ncbi:hypothetical protein C5E16_11240 [Clavibacter michiganensis]|uniref:Uncharacterized protein n=1 Tax=Clavibacter michiganensis TaxID=28447 RepID=A0A2S5VS45_9MICO|nr:hypothetical protein C5E16_11240 [Clavibacter michiganensis]
MPEATRRAARASRAQATGSPPAASSDRRVSASSSARWTAAGLHLVPEPGAGAGAEEPGDQPSA